MDNSKQWNLFSDSNTYTNLSLPAPMVYQAAVEITHKTHVSRM